LFQASAIESLLIAWAMRVVMFSLAPFIFAPHGVAGTTFGHENWFGWKRRMTSIELFSLRMRKSLDVDRVRKKVIEGEHIGQGRASTVQHGCNRLKGWASLFVSAFTPPFIAKRPNDDGWVVSVSLHKIHHVFDVFGIIIEQTVLIDDHHTETIINV
jgi:hypothetical protein